MIDYIKIEGFKSIKKMEMALRPINILIGSNGSGKSNFLSFFDFLNRLYNQKLTEYVGLNGGEDKMLHKGGEVTENISSKIQFGSNAYSFNLRKGDSSFIFTSEGLWYDNNPYYQNPIDISDLKMRLTLKTTLYHELILFENI